MNFRAVVILALIVCAATLAGCGGTSNSNVPGRQSPANSAVANANSAKTNAEELGLYVQIPFTTEDIVWKEEDKKIVAILRFSPADAAKIVAEAEKSGPPLAAEIAVQNWFPPELVAQSEMSGDSALKGMAYPANQFFLEPYTAGRVIRVEGGDYFVLEVSAK